MVRRVVGIIGQVETQRVQPAGPERRGDLPEVADRRGLGQEILEGADKAVREVESPGARGQAERAELILPEPGDQSAPAEPFPRVG